MKLKVAVRPATSAPCFVPLKDPPLVNASRPDEYSMRGSKSSMVTLAVDIVATKRVGGEPIVLDVTWYWRGSNLLVCGWLRRLCYSLGEHPGLYDDRKAYVFMSTAYGVFFVAGGIDTPVDIVPELAP